MEAKRVHGPECPHWVECLDARRNLYAVRWDINENQGGIGSYAHGTNYMETRLSHLPTLREIRQIIEEWRDRVTASQVLSGFMFRGVCIPLRDDNRIRYLTDLPLALIFGVEELPVTVEGGTIEDPVLINLNSLEEVEDFVRSMSSHVKRCETDGRIYKANVNYNLYNDYLEAEEEMTELQKAKAEKRAEVLRERAKREHFYLDKKDVYASAPIRSQMESAAEVGEQVDWMGITLDAPVALMLVRKMEGYIASMDEMYVDKLRAVELAETPQQAAGIDAVAGYPDVVHTTTAALAEAVEAEVTASPALQAVVFAKQVVNKVQMSPTEALRCQSLYPIWGGENAEYGKEVEVGFRLRVVEGATDILYEVIQKHALAQHWKPGIDTLSLYKVVEVKHAGTLQDPIPWTKGMELLNGKYYTDKGVLYKCVRSSGQAMAFDLADLVSGGYVVVEQ